MRVMRFAAAVALAMSGACAGAQPRGDACQAQIPRSLERALAAAFPGYRTPLEFDNAPDDIQRNRAQGGTGCLGVAIADFTGEGKKDYVIGLTARKGSGGLAVVALPRKGGWNFKKINSWSEDARYLQYVDVVQPGRYERTTAVTAALGSGEQRSIDCANWGALVGTAGATGVVYCFDGSRWAHVWVTR
jgi:hypothetical protein